MPHPPSRTSFWMKHAKHFGGGHLLPDLPHPVYLGHCVVTDAHYDTRVIRQPHEGRAVVKIALTHGGAVGGVSDRLVRLRPMQSVVRFFGQDDVWDQFDPKHRGTWEFLGLIFGGSTALSLLAAITQQHGRVLEMDPKGVIFRRLMTLVRQRSHTIEISASDGMRLVTDVLTELLNAAEQATRDRARRFPAEEAADAIARDVRRDWSVQALAQRVGVSREHLTRLFLRHYGVAPHRYVEQMRIREACHLLRTTDLGVKEISATMGFNTRATFLRSFARVTLTTPAEYRRQGGRAL